MVGRGLAQNRTTADKQGAEELTGGEGLVTSNYMCLSSNLSMLTP